jgi:hypothetical protein
MYRSAIVDGDATRRPCKHFGFLGGDAMEVRLVDVPNPFPAFVEMVEQFILVASRNAQQWTHLL